MMICWPVLVKVGTGTLMLNEFVPKVAVLAAPLDTTLVLGAARLGMATAFPPEILMLPLLMLREGVDEMV